jgi:hypothetical protein
VLGALLVLGSLAAVAALDAVALAAVVCAWQALVEVNKCNRTAHDLRWLTLGCCRKLGLTPAATRTALIMFMFSCSMLADTSDK